MRKAFMRWGVATLLCVASGVSGTLFASEGGSSHYVPGAMSSFIDYPTGLPNNFVIPFTYYNGDASASKSFPIAGLLALDVNATFFGVTPTYQFDSPVKLAGGQYAFSFALPTGTLEVEASVTGAGGRTLTKRKTVGGIGDVFVMPFQLFWKKGNWSYQSALGIYAPSGNFQAGRLANMGKNYWTFTPQGSFNYNNMKKGIEATVFTGFNFNTENGATNYQSGQEFYLDFTVDKRFKSGFGVGATGYFFQQITGDSGSGARLGSFKGRDIGIGPELSYLTFLSQTTLLAAELKWLPELDVQNRTQGNYVWLKLAVVWK